MNEQLTAKLIVEYQKQRSELRTVGEFKALGREIRDRHGLTDMQAINILNDKNVIEILAQQESKEAEQ